MSRMIKYMTDRDILCFRNASQGLRSLVEALGPVDVTVTTDLLGEKLGRLKVKVSARPVREIHILDYSDPKEVHKSSYEAQSYGGAQCVDKNLGFDRPKGACMFLPAIWAANVSLYPGSAPSHLKIDKNARIDCLRFGFPLSELTAHGESDYSIPSKSIVPIVSRQNAVTRSGASVCKDKVETKRVELINYSGTLDEVESVVNFAQFTELVVLFPDGNERKFDRQSTGQQVLGQFPNIHPLQGSEPKPASSTPSKSLFKSPAREVKGENSASKAVASISPYNLRRKTVNVSFWSNLTSVAVWSSRVDDSTRLLELLPLSVKLTALALDRVNISDLETWLVGMDLRAARERRKALVQREDQSIGNENSNPRGSLNSPTATAFRSPAPAFRSPGPASAAPRDSFAPSPVVPRQGSLKSLSIGHLVPDHDFGSHEFSPCLFRIGTALRQSIVSLRIRVQSEFQAELGHLLVGLTNDMTNQGSPAPNLKWLDVFSIMSDETVTLVPPEIRLDDSCEFRCLMSNLNYYRRETLGVCAGEIEGYKALSGETDVLDLFGTEQVLSYGEVADMVRYGADETGITDEACYEQASSFFGSNSQDGFEFKGSRNNKTNPVDTLVRNQWDSLENSLANRYIQCYDSLRLAAVDPDGASCLRANPSDASGSYLGLNSCKKSVGLSTSRRATLSVQDVLASVMSRE